MLAATKGRDRARERAWSSPVIASTNAIGGVAMEKLRIARLHLEQIVTELDRFKPSLLRLVGFTVFLLGLGRVLMLVFEAHLRR